MKGAYHTKTKEDPLVFHVFDDCPEGSKIEKVNRRERLKTRELCKECVDLMRKPTN